jgi:hypothetical protein
MMNTFMAMLGPRSQFLRFVAIAGLMTTGCATTGRSIQPRMTVADAGRHLSSVDVDLPSFTGIQVVKCVIDQAPKKWAALKGFRVFMVQGSYQTGTYTKPAVIFWDQEALGVDGPVDLAMIESAELKFDATHFPVTARLVAPQRIWDSLDLTFKRGSQTSVHEVQLEDATASLSCTNTI